MANFITLHRHSDNAELIVNVDKVFMFEDIKHRDTGENAAHLHYNADPSKAIRVKETLKEIGTVIQANKIPPPKRGQFVRKTG